MRIPTSLAAAATSTGVLAALVVATPTLASPTAAQPDAVARHRCGRGVP
jgi:hypothetical protein